MPFFKSSSRKKVAVSISPKLLLPAPVGLLPECCVIAALLIHQQIVNDDQIFNFNRSLQGPNLSACRGCRSYKADVVPL
jgi:hypothetical protein